jgi:arabinogalactan endo-1,4-beta-galactosidase
MVQIGNEVNNGMLWELGRLASIGNFAALEAAGANGINDGRGSAAMPPIMVHVAKDMSASACVAWYQNFIAAGGWVDAIGLSYYPMWHGSQADLKATITALRAAFTWAPVWVVETAYYWSPNTAGYSGSSQLLYAQTPAGQAAFLAATKATVQASGGSGVFYWGAAWSQSSKWLVAPAWTNDDASRRALFNDSAVAQTDIDSL